MGLPGTTELIIIFGVLVLLFGGSKLPKLGGAIGESIRNFKKGIRGLDEEDEQTGQRAASDKNIEGSSDDKQKKAP